MEKTAEQLRSLGAPFARAELHVSVTKKIARFVLVVPMFDYPIADNTPVKETLNAILLAGRLNGMIDKNTTVTVLDLDTIQAN